MPKLTLLGVEQLEQRFTRTETLWKNLSPFFKRCLLILYASIKQNFSTGGRPTKWAKVTRKGKGGKTAKPLRDTGRLMASIARGGSRSAGVMRQTRRGNRSILEWGTNVAYGGVHQFGYAGTQQVKAHKRRIPPKEVDVAAHRRQITITARPFLLMQEEDKQDMMQLADEMFGWG